MGSRRRWWSNSTSAAEFDDAFWIEQIDSILGIHEGIVGLRGDGQVPELHPFLVRVDVVKKTDPSKTLQAHILDVRHSIVCVQGLLEVKLCFARVNANELQLEFGTKRDPVHKAKLSRPPAPGLSSLSINIVTATPALFSTIE